MSVYLTYLYSLIIIIGLEISLLKTDFFWWASIFIILFNIFFVWLSTRRKFNLEFINFLISPFLFILSGLLFLLFSGNFIMKEAVIIFLVVCNSVFLRRLILHNYHKHLYREHSLSSISRIINLSTIFFFYTGFFNLYTFLKVPLIGLLIFSFLVSILIIYQFFNIAKIKTKDNHLFILISALVILEIFYITHWLPILSYAKAILITSVYYYIINLSKHHLQGTLVRQVYFRYALIASIIWVITLLTARWA